MWILLRGLQVLLFLAGFAIAIAVIPSGWSKSSSKAAFAGVTLPFIIGIFALEGFVKRARRRSLGAGLEADGFTVYDNASDPGVFAQLTALRKPGFHGFCSVVGLHETPTELQIAAEYDREEGSGKNRGTVYYSIVAVPCNRRWPSAVVYRWSWMNWEWGTPFLRQRASWMRGLFRWRMVVEPVEKPQPEYLNKSVRRWLWRSPWWRREHWSVDGGWLLLCRRGRLTRSHVRSMLRACDRFKELGSREEW
ncbi:MAG: hypothetical protein QM783_16950 [Phycisphaerales bacterium]